MIMHSEFEINLSAQIKLKE